MSPCSEIFEKTKRISDDNEHGGKEGQDAGHHQHCIKVLGAAQSVEISRPIAIVAGGHQVWSTGGGADSASWVRGALRGAKELGTSGWSLAGAGEGGCIAKVSIPMTSKAGAGHQMPTAGEMAGVKVCRRPSAVASAPPGAASRLLRKRAGESAGGRT